MLCDQATFEQPLQGFLGASRLVVDRDGFEGVDLGPAHAVTGMLAFHVQDLSEVGRKFISSSAENPLEDSLDGTGKERIKLVGVERRANMPYHGARLLVALRQVAVHFITRDVIRVRVL